MNDRFRFRAWSKQLQRYCNIDEMPVSSLAEINSDLIIEQCTGLKDKNGRLIYEGDIVKYTFYGQPGLYRDYGYEGVIRWETNGFNTRSWADEIEVIGNIHEKPELLENQ